MADSVQLNIVIVHAVELKLAAKAFRAAENYKGNDRDEQFKLIQQAHNTAYAALANIQDDSHLIILDVKKESPHAN